MSNFPIHLNPVHRFAVVALLALASLFALGSSAAEAAGGPGRIVFASGKAERCRGDACNRFDVVRSVTPHGAGAQRLALISSAVELASSESGTVAVLSRNVAGGGSNSNSFTNVYILTPNGKRKAVFRDRLEGFQATGMGISGNGKLLVLSARYEEMTESRASKLFVVRADGTGLRQLTDGAGNDKMPALSPDGRKVVFSRSLGSGKSDLYVMPVSGGEPRQLTENLYDDVNPVFSPDGKSVAFGHYNRKTNGGRLAVIRLGQAGERALTSTGKEYPDPDYSPNGRNLVFVSEVLGGKGGFENALYTVRTNGSGRTPVGGGFEDPGLPQWTLRP